MKTPLESKSIVHSYGSIQEIRVKETRILVKYTHAIDAILFFFLIYISLLLTYFTKSRLHALRHTIALEVVKTPNKSSSWPMKLNNRRLQGCQKTISSKYLCCNVCNDEIMHLTLTVVTHVGMRESEEI